MKDNMAYSEEKRGEEPCAAERGYARRAERSESEAALKKMLWPVMSIFLCCLVAGTISEPLVKAEGSSSTKYVAPGEPVVVPPHFFHRCQQWPFWQIGN